jgi:hypothetical protein
MFPIYLHISPSTKKSYINGTQLNRQQYFSISCFGSIYNKDILLLKPTRITCKITRSMAN